jgi:hypothetical protein
MVDYDKHVGTAGTMRIRDTGSTVEFWILCSDGATNTGAYTWSGVVNGVGVGGTTSLPAGFGSRLLGSWGVSTSQTVSFHQNATGTSGLGGAADHSAFIARATVPPAPRSRQLDQITLTSMRYIFDGQGDGGSPITAWQYQYATSGDFSSGASGWINSGGTSTQTGLTPGTVYYFRSRGVNAVGAGPVSDVISARTLAGAHVWNGSAWVPATVSIWDGSSWVPGTVQIWNGSTWVGGQ